MNEALVPLDKYLQVFSKFKEILKMSPEETIKAVDHADPAWDVQQIQDEIIKVKKMEEALKNEIP